MKLLGNWYHIGERIELVDMIARRNPSPSYSLENIELWYFSWYQDKYPHVRTPT